MSNVSMLSNQNTIFVNELKNNGFVLLDEIFKKHGWHMIKNEVNWVSYTKFGNETDLFDIKINQKSIYVSIPIKNSSFQFVTSFKDYFSATEYVESRFMDFISEKN